MSRMKILITGGNGFIARHVATHLALEHSVRRLSRADLDLLDAEHVAEHLSANRYDAVIHAATYDAAPAHSTKDPAKVLENNLKMFFHLARCSPLFGRMLYFGSGAEFGRAHWTPRMAESYFDSHVPADPYGLSKYTMNLHATRPGSNIYNLRLFGVFGEDDDWRTRFLSNACCRAVLGRHVAMNQNRVFDHLYIHDLAKIVRWFLDASPRFNSYNVCSGETRDFLSLAQTVVRVSGKPLEIIVKKTGLGTEYSGDNTRLLTELGPFRFTPIDQAIANVYAWHEAHRDLLNPELL
jgi:GDP-L-fucose synthase